jgi:high-affinity iron transporter
MGALLGIPAAIVLGYLFFVGSLKINIKKFFTVTSIILILFAAGLFAQGIHELQEAGVIPIVVEHVWDINPSAGPDGIYPLLHENGHVGGMLKGLFGYNGNPSLLEVVVYIVYLAVIFMIWRMKNNRYDRPGSASIRRGSRKETLAATY